MTPPKITKQESLDKAFTITSVCISDLESAGFDTRKVDDRTMSELASKMADAYCDSVFWIDLEVIAQHLGIKQIRANKLRGY